MRKLRYVIAFDALVDVAIELPDYETGPAWHGNIRDFRYFDEGTRKQPFAFIVNRSDLLFYVRLAGLDRVPGGSLNSSGNLMLLLKVPVESGRFGSRPETTQSA